jgi:ribonucleoside-diphosphate reductase alpha chain
MTSKEESRLMEMSVFSKTIMEQKYSHTLANGTKESWENIAYRVTKNVLRAAGFTMRDSLAKEVFQMIRLRKFVPGGRYLYASGRPFHQVQNCLLMRAEDSREGWSQLAYNASMALMTGAGIGIDYSDIRAEGKIIRKTGGQATGPLALMGIINEAGRRIMQGGSRRSAIWAGLNWNHADIHNFITMKNWNKHELAGKEEDFNFPATMDGTNISTLLDDQFFKSYHDEKDILHARSHDVYWSTVRQMLKTAEPGFSIDVGENAGETLRNACTEVCSRDDSDICNLGSINLARIDNLSEMTRVVELATVFLLAGTLYSSVPQLHHYEELEQA